MLRSFLHRLPPPPFQTPFLSLFSLDLRKYDVFSKWYKTLLNITVKPLTTILPSLSKDYMWMLNANCIYNYDPLYRFKDKIQVNFFLELDQTRSNECYPRTNHSGNSCVRHSTMWYSYNVSVSVIQKANFK